MMPFTKKEQSLKKIFILFFATGAGAGYSPVAPGTLGTLMSVPLALVLSVLTPLEGAMALIAAICAAFFLASSAKTIIGGKDPRSIVCDEIAGFLTALYLVPITLTNVILVFILFRIFDILKPFPIGLIDRKMPGGAGIVLDDVAAGIFANISANLAIKFIL